MMNLENRNLHYQISNWNQITECLSNNSKNLYLSLNKILDGNKLKGEVIQVNHSMYGTLFAAMISGSGRLITETDDEIGYDLPFLTTQEILKQIAKFGFYVKYDEKSNLPGPTLDFIQNMMELGYDKITEVLLQSSSLSGNTIWKPAIIIFKSVDANVDLLSYGQKLTRSAYMKKVDANTVLNVTYQNGSNWDWVDCLYNLSDIMDENLDPVDEYKLETNIRTGQLTPYSDTSSETLSEEQTVYEDLPDSTSQQEDEDDDQ